MKNIGVLWDEEVDTEGDMPFDKEHWNREYMLFSDIAEKLNVKFYLTGYLQYSNGKLKEAFTVKDEEWVKVQNIELDGVFDKFKFDDSTFELKKKIAEDIGILNNPELEEICKDKLKTGRLFSQVPETKKATEENIMDFLEDGKTVVKPRYDFGGRGVQIIDSMEELNPVNSEDHVVQRFVDSSSGVPETEYNGVHDLRAYVVDGEIIFGLLRSPDEGLVSNVARGGNQYLFPKEEFREDALELVEEVKKEFSRFSPAMYSVDMIYDEEENPWIVELNSKPGLSFYDDMEMRGRVIETVKKLCLALKEI